MGKGYYRELTDILKTEAGAVYLKNAKGAHEKWQTKDGQTLIVPRPCVSPHTANNILRDAGLTKRF